MNCLGFGLLFFIFQFVNVAFSKTDCSKYLITVDPPQCRAGNNVIIDKNITVSLSSDCKVYLDGCLYIANPFQSARIIYEAKAGILSLFSADDMKNGDDICEKIEKFDIGSALGVACPVTEGDQRICSTGANSLLDISPFASAIPMAIGLCGGKITASVTVFYDGCTTKKDRIDLSLTIAEVKKKKS